MISLSLFLNISSSKKSLANSGVGLSPFKDEKTPSFSVRRENGTWYDFSSGKGGNLYTFVKHYFNCSSREAANIIKGYAGYDGEVVAPKERYETTKLCKRFAAKQSNKKQASQTILPDDHMERYERREDKLSIWKSEGISDESLEKYQVRYDSFSNRLVYPIRNPEGKIVNVGGRALDEDWKERGERKYTYFYSWGTMTTIYGLAENMENIIAKNEVIIFEGCKSVLMADTWGIDNACAILTSHLNPAQTKLLARLGVNVVFALDKDVRVRDDGNIQKLKRYTKVQYIWDHEDLLDEKDSPVDKGEEVFRKLYAERLTLR